MICFVPNHFRENVVRPLDAESSRRFPSSATPTSFHAARDLLSRLPRR